MGIKPARQEMRKSLWRWLVILSIATALPLICSMTPKSGIKEVTFDGQNLYISSLCEADWCSRLDLIVDESGLDLAANDFERLPGTGFVESAAYEVEITEGTGNSPIHLIEPFERKASVDANELPELDEDKQYYLAAIYEEDDYIRVKKYVDITDVLLHKTAYHAPMPANYGLLLGPAFFFLVVLMLLFGVPLFITIYLRRNPPAVDAPDDWP